MLRNDVTVTGNAVLHKGGAAGHAVAGSRRTSLAVIEASAVEVVRWSSSCGGGCRGIHRGTVVRPADLSTNASTPASDLLPSIVDLPARRRTTVHRPRDRHRNNTRDGRKMVDDDMDDTAVSPAAGRNKIRVVGRCRHVLRRGDQQVTRVRSGFNRKTRDWRSFGQSRCRPSAPASSAARSEYAAGRHRIRRNGAGDHQRLRTARYACPHHARRRCRR